MMVCGWILWYNIIDTTIDKLVVQYWCVICCTIT